MNRLSRSIAEDTETQLWSSVGEIPGFPFDDFEQLQAAVAERSFNIGVDALAAAQWADRYSRRLDKIVVGALSLLVLAAAFAAVVAAFSLPDYWLLAALPAQALTFYVSHPASPIRKWVTVGGALSIAAFINLLLNGYTTAATIVACAGLTFAAVRMAGFLTNAAFRRALLADEELFLAAYSSRVCTVRNNRTERVYSR
jgi:hypothetical protein